MIRLSFVFKPVLGSNQGKFGFNER